MIGNLIVTYVWTTKCVYNNTKAHTWIDRYTFGEERGLSAVAGCTVRAGKRGKEGGRERRGKEGGRERRGKEEGGREQIL